MRLTRGVHTGESIVVGRLIASPASRETSHRLSPSEDSAVWSQRPALGAPGAERHLLEVVRRLDSSRAHSTILCYGQDFYSQRQIDRPDVRGQEVAFRAVSFG